MALAAVPSASAVAEAGFLRGALDAAFLGLASVILPGGWLVFASLLSVAGGWARGDWVGGWLGDPNESRYGCYLPVLTGLARCSSTANLPVALYQDCGPPGQGPPRMA